MGAIDVLVIIFPDTSFLIENRLEMFSLLFMARMKWIPHRLNGTGNYTPNILRSDIGH